MTPQERQLIDDLFDRLSKLESAPRDPDAAAAIAQGLRKAPSAVYALVQTVLVQDEALRQAHDRIEALEAQGAPEQQQSGGFLDSMRDAIVGQDHSHDHAQDQSRGSVPNVPPRDMGSRDPGSRPVWNSGQAMQRGQYSDPQYNQGQYNRGQYGQGQYGQPPYGAPQGAPMGGSPMGGGLMGGAFGGGGGSFLGTAAATAAGMVGGSLLLNSFRSMMPGGHQGFGDPTTIINEKVVNQNPWGDQSRSELARDAGVNDVNSQDRTTQDLAAQDRAQDLEQDREDDNSRSGFFDSASNDDDHDDIDSDDFGNDGNSDYA